MKTRILFLCLLLIPTLFLSPAASADPVMEGASSVVWQVGLSSNTDPAGGGFCSHSVMYWLPDGAPSDTVWSLAPSDGGPAFSMRSQGEMGFLTADPGSVYTAGTVSHYTITARSSTFSVSKAIEVSFVDDLPSGPWELCSTPIEFSASAATAGQSTAWQDNTLELLQGHTYMVSGTLPANSTFSACTIAESHWSTQEWTVLYPGNEPRLDSLNIDYGSVQVFTANEPGTYSHRYLLQYAGSNLACSIPYTLEVLLPDGTRVPPQLDPRSMEVTWYTGLPADGSLHSLPSIGQMWVPERVRDYSDTQITWQLVHVSGPDNFDLRLDPRTDWMDSYFRAEVQPKSGTLATGTSEYRMEATYQGVTYQGTLVIHTEVPAQVPTGMTLSYAEFDPATQTTSAFTAVPDGGDMVLDTGKTYVFSSGFIGTAPGDPENHWLNPWFCEGLQYRDRWANLDAQGNPLFHPFESVIEAGTPGTYSCGASLDISDTNMEGFISFTLKVRDASGHLPAKRLENGNSAYTWYTGIPSGGNAVGLRCEEDFIQIRIPADAWRGTQAGAPVWTVTNHHDSAADIYEFDIMPESWNDGRGIILHPRWTPGSETVTGTNTFTVTAVYNGETYEDTETISFVQDSYPGAITMTVDEVDLNTNTIIGSIPNANGSFTLTEGHSYVLTTDFAGPVPASGQIAYMNGWCDLLDTIDRYDSRFMTPSGSVWADNQMIVTAKKSGIRNFSPSLSLGMSNLAVSGKFALQIADSTGVIPTPRLELDIDSPEQNVYLGLANYGGGIGYDSIGVWGEKGRPSVSFADYDSLRSAFGGSPAWSVRRLDGIPFECSSWQENAWNNQGFLSFELPDPPSQPGDVEYEITCSWGNLTDTVRWTVHYIRLATVPTGHDCPELFDQLEIGQTLVLEPGAEPAGVTLPGYSWYIHLFSEQLEAFATLDRAASTPQKKVYTVDRAGVYNATILLRADTVIIGKEVIFRVKDAGGTVPKPDIQVSSWNNFERSIYIGVPLATDPPSLGQLTSDTFIDHLYFDNETVLGRELQGTPVWTLTEDGAAPEHAALRAEDGGQTLHLKAMPSVAKDVTYTLTCQWDGQTWSGDYTVHYISTHLPSGVSCSPRSQLIVCKPGDYLDYDIGFTDWQQPAGEGAWRDLSPNLKEAASDWDCAPGRPGVWEGYMETGCANLVYRVRLTVIVTEPDGTMKASDYTPQGTVWHLPAGMTRIESQAFSGTRLTEADIPAGTAVAQDAFAGTGLLAVYTHNDPNLIQWALDFGAIALTE